MGWASGMRAGIDIGRAYNEGVERKRLEGIRTAAPETSQGYTAEQGQQLEAMASAINPETGRPYYNVQVGEGGNYTVTPDFTEAQTPRTGMDTGSQYGVANVELQPTGLGRAGVAAQPIPFNQQRVTDFLGRRFEGELTPDRIEAMRSRAMAEGLSDPRQRQAALAEATRAEREAEEAPLRQEALRTQVEAGKLGLKKVGFELTAAERTAADAQKMDDFSAWRSQNPQADFAAMSAKAQELGMSTDAQFKIASNFTGIKEQEFKASQQRIQELVKDQGLDGLLKAHKESKDLDPNSHFEVTRGQGGRITLNRVNTATGEIVQPNVFSGSEAETTAYLNKQAMNPATVIDFTMNLEKNKSGLAKDAAAIEASKATTNLYSARAKGLQADDATQARLKDIRDQFTALTPEQKLGPEGRALEREYNMVTAGPGKQVSTGAAPRPEVTAAAVASYAKDLVGKPSGEMKDGKPVRYTAETAAAAARRALSAQDGAAADPAAADPADALIEAMRKNAPAQQQATPAGQGLINLSNTMLPPAAPVRAAPTTSQERLRGLYLGQ
jgi:hypothetical protein